MKLPLIIDGVDFTDTTSKYGYSQYQVIREGNNGGIMLSGERVTDIIAQKIGVTIPLNPMTGAEASAILSAVRKSYVTATVWNVYTGEEYESVFIPTISSANIAILRDTEKWWNGVVVTLEEK